MPATGVPTRFRLDWGRDLTLTVHNLGLACCAVEVVAATMRRDDLSVPATERVAVDVLCVSGTVTDKLAPAVRRVYDSFPTLPYVMSFGACANSGGPYWDSYCVTNGVDRIVPVDIYVPGCPPRPEAFVDALHELERRIGVGA